MTTLSDLIREVEIRELERLQQKTLAAKHPAFLLHHVKCVDSRSGDVFEFELLTPEECELIGAESRVRSEPFYAERDTPVSGKDWSWQRLYLEWIIENDQTITLKGRQLGVTWVWAGLALWYLLNRPGSDVLVYSIKEEDAIEVVNRIWDMFLSTPPHLLNGVKVLKPSRGARPSTRIELEHPDGRVSTITGMPGTKSAGHSRAAALVIFDEASRQDYARELWKAVIPASGDKGGKIGVVSTANGMSDERAGTGNFFHHLCVNAGMELYPRLKKVFLGWWFHPDRDQEWYDHLSLDGPSKAEQYPNDEDEAFLMSGSPYFDVDHLKWYTKNAKAVRLYQAEFETFPADPTRARLAKRDGCPIEVFREPQKDRKYAIGLDNATGHGTDYSVAAVIDLHDGFPCAEMHVKGDEDRVAEQVHFLGLWFNKAVIAPEKQGGYGDTVIAYLRDGKNGRKPYPRLYRYRSIDHSKTPESAIYGFPMNSKTRPLAIAELTKWIRDHLFPVMTSGLLSEARVFVRRDTKPSPRAADGTNDDRVLAWAIATELYREFGEHEHDVRKKKGRKRTIKSKTSYPWQNRGTTNP